MRRLTELCLILVSIGIAAPNLARAGSKDQSLAWAERLLRQVPALPSRGAPEFMPRIGTRHAAEAFEAVERKYGESARGDRGLAAGYMRVGQYGRARDLYAKVLKLAPSDRAARRGLEQAAQLATVADGVKAQLPKGYAVRQVRRVRSANGRPLWACLTAKVYESGPWWWSLGDLCVGLHENEGGAWRRVSQIENVGDPSFDECDDAEFYVLDMDGDGMPEIDVCTFLVGCSCAQSHLTILRWCGETLVKVTGFYSQYTLWIEDLDHDGRYEVGTVGTIGDTLVECEKPFWNDIYAYRRGAYRCVNRKPHGAFYSDFTTDIREALHVHPDDWRLWYNLAEAEESLGHRQAALHAYRRSEQYVDQIIDGTSCLPCNWRQHLAEIRSRIRELQ